MTSSIPDSFSTEDLQALLADAPSDEANVPSNEDGTKFSEEQIDYVVGYALDQITDAIPDPVAHKAALVRVAYNMIRWHTAVADQQFAAGNKASGTAWMRDAGKWQAILDIATSISLGDNDAWCVQA